ncbi:TPA: helix-turn-helix transcriptional regulator [Streptococcus suis]|nr:helix-turn-helix transcriptional regulator [Streptococcus suis]
MNNTNQLQEFISNRIRYLRKEKGLSQEQLSEKAGLGARYIHKIENKGYNVRIETLNNIISALDLTFEEFFNFSFPNTSEELDNFQRQISNLPTNKQKDVLEHFTSLLKHM